MIEHVLAGLKAAGVQTEDLDPLQMSMMARFAGNTTVIAFIDGGMFVVKVGNWKPLAGEYETLQRLYRLLPRYTAEPLALVVPSAMEVMVVRGVPHEPAPARPMGLSALRLAAEIGDFLVAAHESLPVSSEQVESEAVLAARVVAERLPGLPLHAYVEEQRTLLHNLQGSSQHGDFTMTNLGESERGLLVFDWEDFDGVHLPGFDMATLLLSVHQFDVHALRRAVARKGSFSERLVTRAAPALGLEPAQFLALLPCYLSCFIEMKARRGYGDYVQNLALEALRASLV